MKKTVKLCWESLRNLDKYDNQDILGWEGSLNIINIPVLSIINVNIYLYSNADSNRILGTAGQKQM